MSESINAADQSRIGALISDGRTSEVYRYGLDGALKVLKRATPYGWAQVEASFTSSVRRLGVSAPEVREVIDVDGRAAIHFELIDGPSMWTRMVAEPGDIPALARELASVQRAIHAAGVPDGLPSLVARVRAKLDLATDLDERERERAIRVLNRLPRGGALLHGDLHPENVLLAERGPVVIDWFDASVGHPIADIARTTLLLQATGATDLRHLPGASVAIVEEIHGQYLAAIGGESALAEQQRAGSDADDWLRLMAAARLAERTDADISGLLETWVSGSSSDD